jgi:hypothetical protein
MLRTSLIAAALLTASAGALAHQNEVYVRVVPVEPHWAVSFGGPYPNSFQVFYESGGYPYGTRSYGPPVRVIRAPYPVYGYPDRRHAYGHEDKPHGRHEYGHHGGHHRSHHQD